MELWLLLNAQPLFKPLRKHRSDWFVLPYLGQIFALAEDVLISILPYSSFTGEGVFLVIPPRVNWHRKREKICLSLP